MACLPEAHSQQQLPDLSTIPPDLTVPALSIETSPAPGLRLKQTTPGWEHTEVYHTLYLPTDWKPGGKYPVIAEYPGNGNYRNQYGDVSDGSPEGCLLGYGLTGGTKGLWVCLPYVQLTGDKKLNAVTWWGDVSETKRYALATLALLREKYGADPQRIILAGFSRGAIGCNFIGLHDDEIATPWCAFFSHSHYDGVSERWPYPGADRASALTRLQRLGARPQWISHEGTVAEIEKYLTSTGVKGDYTLRALPYRNHSAAWVLRDIPERRDARAWLERVLTGGTANPSGRP